MASPHSPRREPHPPQRERTADELLGLLDDALDLGDCAVRVSVNGGTVRLEGAVRDEFLRRSAEEIARGFASAERVENHLRVETTD